MSRLVKSYVLRVELRSIAPIPFLRLAQHGWKLEFSRQTMIQLQNAMWLFTMTAGATQLVCAVLTLTAADDVRAPSYASVVRLQIKVHFPYLALILPPILVHRMTHPQGVNFIALGASLVHKMTDIPGQLDDHGLTATLFRITRRMESKAKEEDEGQSLQTEEAHGRKGKDEPLNEKRERLWVMAEAQKQGEGEALEMEKLRIKFKGISKAVNLARELDGVGVPLDVFERDLTEEELDELYA